MKQFDKEDMINFVKWYDNKTEDKCHRTFEEEFIEWLQTEQNSHKHSVVRESPIVKEEVDLYLKGQRDTIKLIFDYILGLDEPLVGGGQAQNVSDGLPKRKSFKERLAEEMEKAKIGQPKGG